MPNKRSLVSQAARLLGSQRSPRKATASRKNGRLGGRPRKMPPTPAPSTKDGGAQ